MSVVKAVREGTQIISTDNLNIIATSMALRLPYKAHTYPSVENNAEK